MGGADMPRGATAGVLVYETVRSAGLPLLLAQLYVSSDAAASPLGFLSEDSQNYFGTQIELLKSARLQNAVYEQAWRGSRREQEATD